MSAICLQVRISKASNNLTSFYHRAVRLCLLPGYIIILIFSHQTLFRNFDGIGISKVIKHRRDMKKIVIFYQHMLEMVQVTPIFSIKQ